MSLNKIQKQMLEQNVQNKLDEIGILSKLTTNSKTSLVDSINETNEHLAQKANETDLQSKRNVFQKIEPEDLSERALELVTGGGSVSILSEPRPNSVSWDKYDKAIVSENLFDKDKITIEYTINANTGVLEVSTSRNVSDFIKIDSETTYVIKSVKTYVFFDAGKNYLSGYEFSAEEGYTTKQVTSPPNAMYARFSYYNTGSNKISDSEQMFIKGNVLPSDYIPHYFKLKDLKIGEEGLDNELKQHLEKISEKTNELDSRMEKTYNLFDKKQVVKDKYVDLTTGTLVDSTSQNASDYISVTPNKTYTVVSARNIVFYNENKQFISSLNPSTIDMFDYVFDAPSNAHYVRFSYYVSYSYAITDDEQMLYEGEVKKEYVPYGYFEPNVIVKKDNLDADIMTLLSPKEEGIILENTEGWQSFDFVDGNVWGFQRSDIDATTNGIGEIYIYTVLGELLNTLKHNFGHCNTVSYKAETDTLILGNGSGYNNTDGKIFIIEKVKHWKDFPENTLLDLEGENIEGSVITIIDVARDFGNKVNVFWGEDNFNQYNICYVVSNDAQNIRKLLLGKGTNQYENGQFIVGRATSQFNGTYKIVGEWTANRLDVVQGGCYYNGALYLGLGHDGLWCGKYNLNQDGTTTITEKHERFYKVNGDGDNTRKPTCGVTVYDGMIYHAIKIELNAVFKYRPF